MAAANITAFPFTPRSGYDLRVNGLDSDKFLAIHITALCCIFLGLVSAIAVIIKSFQEQSFYFFFQWAKSDRFVVYIAICDGLFNISHSMDHLHIIITRNHVYPKGLCTFYSFILAEFTTAQKLMVNIVSINAFLLIFFKKRVNFGECDWKLLAWIFGLPGIALFVAVGFDTLGPNGTL